MSWLRRRAAQPRAAASLPEAAAAAADSPNCASAPAAADLLTCESAPAAARTPTGAAATPTAARSRACARCTHWDDNRHTLERRIAGLVVFGSGFGASVATSRLCTLHDRLVSPGDRCPQFAPRP